MFLGSDSVRAESVVYPDDQVRTEEGRATLSLARGAVMVLGRNSSTVLRQADRETSISLEKGNLAVSFPSQQQAARVEADGLYLSPSGAFPALAEVAMNGDGSLVVAVHRGKISIADLRAEPVVVTAGQVITIAPRLAQAQQSKSVGTGAHGKMTLGEKLRTFHIGSLSHGVSLAIVTGALAGATATAVIVPLTVGTEESPFKP
ncbi:MAG: FecR domain-containing protein [Burkholderiales bacterium]